MPGEDVKSVHTALLEVAYEDDGSRDGSPVMLLRGWPDAPRGWNGVARALHSAGWRTIVPYLRGSPPTQFLSQGTPRFGAAVALAQDAIELADALGFDRFAVVGHDWGARTAYTMGALFPERLSALAALSVGYQPRGLFKVPDFEQSKRFWYQLQRGLHEVERLSTPTLMIQGGSDYCDDPKESEGLERFSTGKYKRILLEGIGHFPHRESPTQVAEAVIRLIQDAG